jgi:hypothetical protein
MSSQQKDKILHRQRKHNTSQNTGQVINIIDITHRNHIWLGQNLFSKLQSTRIRNTYSVDVLGLPHKKAVSFANRRWEIGNTPMILDPTKSLKESLHLP